MAMPMIIVGLMVGSIFGLLTAVGAEMVGGGSGLGNRLTYYSSLIQMPQFFAVILILAIIGILDLRALLPGSGRSGRAGRPERRPAPGGIGNRRETRTSTGETAMNKLRCPAA